MGAYVADLLAIGQPAGARGAASIFALAVATYRSASMIKAILQRRWSIDLLALTPIASTVAVGEYIASLIIVLMLTGGEALERLPKAALPASSNRCSNVLPRNVLI